MGELQDLDWFEQHYLPNSIRRLYPELIPNGHKLIVQEALDVGGENPPGKEAMVRHCGIHHDVISAHYNNDRSLGQRCIFFAIDSLACWNNRLILTSLASRNSEDFVSQCSCDFGVGGGGATKS